MDFGTRLKLLNAVWGKMERMNWADVVSNDVYRKKYFLDTLKSK